MAKYEKDQLELSRLDPNSKEYKQVYMRMKQREHRNPDLKKQKALKLKSKK